MRDVFSHMAEKSERQITLESLEYQQKFDAGLAKIDKVEGFDASLGVETSRPVEPWEVGEADDTTLVNNARYSPTPVRTIRQAISAAAVRCEDTSFVDFGCGKGRVLLVAATYPFRRVIGVEFSNDLCETAGENVERHSENSESSDSSG
jgi:SAM-dependent methyltransferase